jgi:MFS family permease
MGINWERFIIALLVAALFGIVYTWLVDRVYRASPDHPYTFVLVLFGVAGTLALGLFVVPAHWIVLLFVLFGATGVPQIIGAAIRDDQRRRENAAREREKMRQAFEETLR